MQHEPDSDPHDDAGQRRCLRHGMPLPCDSCGQEDWRTMLRRRLPTWPELPTSEPIPSGEDGAT